MSHPVDISERIKKVMSQVFGQDIASISEDSSPDNIPTWDSLQHMNLILGLEEEFQVHFNENQIAEMINFKLIEITLEETINGHISP